MDVRPVARPRPKRRNNKPQSCQGKVKKWKGALGPALAPQRGIKKTIQKRLGQGNLENGSAPQRNKKTNNNK